jgi:hypothetical protein
MEEERDKLLEGDIAKEDIELPTEEGLWYDLKVKEEGEGNFYSELPAPTDEALAAMGPVTAEEPLTMKLAKLWGVPAALARTTSMTASVKVKYTIVFLTHHPWLISHLMLC